MASGGESDAIDDAALSLLLLRAARLREPVAAADDPADLVWVAAFPLGEETFAFPLKDLRAAFPLRNVALVPLAPAGVVGITRFEGALLTVLSLASLLGLRAWPKDTTHLLVVEPEPRRRVAVDTCEVPIAEPLARTAVLSAPRGTDGIAVVTAKGGSSVKLIDLPTLLATAARRTARG
jgi:chemotaxis signal transduction protein